jgi:EAL domain-containing protein (putative c-di-GMP-specific phosphodiesterase class I)
MDEELRQAQLLELDLRQALARGEMSLEFQPIAATPGPRIVGFEALVRWTHPLRGRVPPDRFIGVAENCGAILPIGDWVLRTACREAASWTNPLTVAVNVSPLQVQQAGFAARVEAILGETGLAPHRLELEVTESLFIAEPAKVSETLGRLRALGVRIALDDFGTGYSSLATLRNFPFDKVKIDRSFVGGLGSDAQADAIVRGVLGLASGLGLPVVAEGVESAYQLDRLRAEGCFAVQGYLIGRPQPIGCYDLLTGAPPGPTTLAAE